MAEAAACTLCMALQGTVCKHICLIVEVVSQAYVNNGVQFFPASVTHAVCAELPNRTCTGELAVDTILVQLFVWPLKRFRTASASRFSILQDRIAQVSLLNST